MMHNNIDSNNKDILITGGADFIGSNLAFYFQDIADTLQNELRTDLGTEYFLNPHDDYQTHTQANIIASINNLGFKPKVSLEQGIKSYIAEIKRLHGNEII